MEGNQITVVYKWTAHPEKLGAPTDIYKGVTRAMEENEPGATAVHVFVSEDDNAIYVRDEFATWPNGNDAPEWEFSSAWQVDGATNAVERAPPFVAGSQCSGVICADRTLRSAIRLDRAAAGVTRRAHPRRDRTPRSDLARAYAIPAAGAGS